MTPLPRSFFESHDVVSLAKKLLGKQLFTHFDTLTGGTIVETEAYAGIQDRASHAYGGRRTERNEVMYGPPGHAYVYLCYGIHHLLNIVTAPAGTPHAILIRAIRPTHGIETMLSRRNKSRLDATLTSGPGSLTAALGITRAHNKLSFDTPPLFLSDASSFPNSYIVASPRIGIDYAGEDAKLLYRFQLFESL